MTDVATRVETWMKQAEAVLAGGPFSTAWDSLETQTIPAWYQDAKFGIFIHWGLYAVPAFGNEWYPRNMYKEGTKEFAHHVATYGPQAKFGYKDFIPGFTAPRFDAAQWARLFRQAGARFVVPVAEHHDGFAMYATALSKWNAAKMGPRRDILGLLADAIRREGMVFGLSSHRIEHWWFMNGGMAFDSDVKRGRHADFYGPAVPDNTPPSREFMNDWLARCCELVDRYQPQLFWFDWWIEHAAMKAHLRKFAAYYYNRGAQWGRGVAINYKHDAYTPRAAVLDVERGQLADIRPTLWQNDTAVAKNSWGHVRPMDYKTPASLIGELVDVVSKNGCLLLNVGPHADGHIPKGDRDILLSIGRWLKVNGEAIYGTRPWKVFGEGPTPVAEGAFTDARRAAFTAADFRFTARGRTTLYAIGLGWPAKGRIVIRSLSPALRLLSQEIEDVAWLGCREKPRWSRRTEGLVIEAPREKPCEHAFTVKVTLHP